MGRYDYVRYDEKSQENSDFLKGKFQDITSEVETLLRPSRHQALALTKLEEAFMCVAKQFEMSRQIVRYLQAQANIFRMEIKHEPLLPSVL